LRPFANPQIRQARGKLESVQAWNSGFDPGQDQTKYTASLWQGRQTDWLRGLQPGRLQLRKEM
jgi:hypothetical protein